MVISEVNVTEHKITAKGGMSSSGLHYRGVKYKLINDSIYITSYVSYIPDITKTLSYSDVIVEIEGDFKNVKYVFIDVLPYWKS